ncbi:RNA polymerase sigma factor [Paracoccus sp. M683]|uniref:RNA polymerase sigma factor n=1 Tax=Paracoccus sp. M683 TaxID=2594268 RepID=UPI00117C63BB|nr:RNA polymerase sigma factor [Paracoccus sp. M683]TRW98400.1 RNA polymerase sigma factor [Paracoccus sp. M683]
MSDTFSDDLIDFLPNLKRYAMSLCRRPDLADDLVQTTVERAFRNRDSFDPATKMQAWLLRILRNAWIDMTRRDKTRGTQLPIDDAPALAGDDGPRVVEGRLMLDQTRQAIDRLSGDQRDVLILVCMQEVTYQEAADILEIPIGTVMSRLARARKALAADLNLDGWE